MEAWQNFLLKLEESLGKEVIGQWLRPLVVKQFDACNLHLEAQNAFQIAWFEEHVRPKLKQLYNNNYHRIKVRIQLSTEQSFEKSKNKRSTPPSILLNFDPDALDEHATLDCFHFGKENHFIAKFFETFRYAEFNPLLLYGPPSCGKTHLLSVLASLLKMQGYPVFYVHAETFTEHVVKAMRNFQMQPFRLHYRHQEVLIIDDIQLLAGRTATQEEFFHTFNALHSRGKQIILASNAHPEKIQGIEARLISRFEWGLSLKLSLLKSDELPAFFTCLLKKFNLELSQEAHHFFLSSFHHQFSLLRALQAYILRNKERQRALSEVELKLMLKDLLQLESKPQLTPEKILTLVADYFGITPTDLLGKSQEKQMSLPRQIAMYLFRRQLAMPYQKIGKFFSRDHSTVMAHIKKIEEEKPTLSQEVLQIIETN